MFWMSIVLNHEWDEPLENLCEIASIYPQVKARHKKADIFKKPKYKVLRGLTSTHQLSVTRVLCLYEKSQIFWVVNEGK